MTSPTPGSIPGQRPAPAPTDYRLRLRDCVLGAQMLFVAFGALVLVPILTGLDSNVALFTAGVGTLLFQLCTRGKVPIFLASSFAFIAPIIYGVQTWGMPQTLGALVCCGFVYFIVSALVRWRGTEFVLRLLPPIVTGPVIMVIGLFYRQGLMGTKEFSWDAIFSFFGKIGRFFKNLFTGQKAVKGGAANE